MARLAGKVALVTGAASGIGRASSILFAREGAAVLAVDRSADVHETARLIAEAGGTALGREADAADARALGDLVALAERDLGPLSVCFANAGISGRLEPLLDLTVEEWTEVLRVNLIGAFLAVQASARVMLPRGAGSIICTASVAGLRSGAGGSHYSASKAGVVSLVQTAANQFSGSGVRVNAICPGLIETGMTKPLFDHARARGTEGKLGQLNPLRRAGAPDEIARMALFLASDEASYVNGQAIAVDGGLSSSHPTVPGKLA